MTAANSNVQIVNPMQTPPPAQAPPGNGDSREVQGAAPVKGLSTFCNSLESAIFPKLRKRMPSFFLFPPEGQMTS